MAEGKRVQLESSFIHEAEHFYERLENKKTGAIRQQESTEPHITSSKTTAITKPSTAADNGTIKSSPEGGMMASLASRKPGYDTSQL
jgi:hypothetical protein